METQKKVAPNGFYWANIWLSDNKGKCVKVEPIEEMRYDYLAWSNSSRVSNDLKWIPSDIKGWYYKYCYENELTIFNWNYIKN